jgi:membrane dipeptidase
MLTKSLIFDAHLDLAMNALEWNRDLRWRVEDIRKSEEGMTDKPDRAKGTVSLPSMREGQVGLCIATQIARYVKRGNNIPGWSSPEQAWAQTQGQLAWYKTMEDNGEIVQIRTPNDLQKHLHLWENPSEKEAIGYILSLEGADSIISMDHLQTAYDYGLRAIGPAHYGPGTYAYGTDSNGGISIKGRELLKEMERLGIILDATHLFTDEQITELANRNGVIGIALDAWMMVPGWIRGKSDPKAMGVSLKLMINNIDHICQLTGNSLHAGIGSDLDGAFGREQCPYDLDTIADLQKVPAMLSKIGYSASDIKNILSDNWISFLKKNLPL